MTTVTDVSALLEPVAARAREAGVFGEVRLSGGRLVCEASGSAAPAEYRMEAEDGRLWVSLVTADRWLSESIETELLHSGDKIEELIDEEMVELGYAGGQLPMQHYRSEDKLFTFRSAVPVTIPAPSPAPAAEVELAVQALLGYEAAFRQLGDMDESDEED